MPELEANRRPIASRSAGWAKALAAVLARTSVTPNQISAVSVVFAAVGAALLAFKPDAIGLIGCAAAVQGRLVCNLLDGMVAIEGGKKSSVGSLYNEFPDRIADSLFIVALGYAVGWPALGWFGALAAALTAYVRVFGGSLGFAQDFRGPIAKQQRMAVLTAACVVGAATTCIAACRKGRFFPVPLICTVRFGAPLPRIADEDKSAFLERARNAVIELAK
jgi:phosphatidylglycerophosphate synthase